MTYFFIFVVLLFLAYLFILNLKTKARRMAAKFAMYDARDKFVFLVADDVIDELDPVFSFYYSRINDILSAAPNIGLDHMLSSILKSKTSNIHDSIRRVKERTRELNNEKSMEIPAVKEAVTAYLLASKAMILSHSSLLKINYVILKNREKYAMFKHFYSGGSYVEAAEVVDSYNDAELCHLAHMV